jgi:hypothetical protein
MSDSLIFIKNCYQADRPDKGRNTLFGFSIKAVLRPPFKEGEESIIHFEIIPYHDYEYGIEYSVVASSNIEIDKDDFPSWNYPIKMGDILSLDVPMRALSKGFGGIGINLYGFKESRKTGRLGDNEQILRTELFPHFIIDESLRIIGYREHYIEPLSMMVESKSENPRLRARMEKIEALRMNPDYRTIFQSPRLIEKKDRYGNYRKRK